MMLQKNTGNIPHMHAFGNAMKALRHTPIFIDTLAKALEVKWLTSEATQECRCKWVYAAGLSWHCQEHACGEHFPQSLRHHTQESSEHIFSCPMLDNVQC